MSLTPSSKRRLFAELLALAGGALAVAVGGWYIFQLKCDSESFFCENDVSREYPSPSGGKKFVLYLRGCGATTGFVTNGSLLPAGAPLPDQPGNVFRATGGYGPLTAQDAGGSLDVTWSSEAEVLITHPRAIRMEPIHGQVDGVRVSYAESP
jgi:hypothetical protein